ncbi:MULTISPECIES: hemerythrin domain-containing protein [Aquincola]|uniref:hemerythrin domain-containing protein n=1 Tax=Aquincola TaxID=391952 RepID=UPI000614B531|nr:MULTISPECIES: hemerythrin domain-containing protein [Aquincola]MCR5868597.1 hemerythrin domain-containing protein [Aquincola sp. J276]
MPTANTATTRTTRAAPARKDKEAPDALTLLTQDHDEVKKLFKKYEKLVKAEAGAQEREALANQICLLLTVHAQIEEEIFYPAAREVLPEADLVDEATVEHASAKDLIAQIESMTADDDLYDAKVTVLGEYIEHHVKEEQEEMFPKLRRRIDIKAVGAELLARKQELMEGKAVLAH